MLHPRLDWIFMLYACLYVVDISHAAKIINGREVVPYSMPFMALVLGEYVCGGTLISPNWVLTAAHCKKISYVVLGMHSISQKEFTKQFRTVRRSIPHPFYNKINHNNDFMLLELDRPVMESDTVKVLPLDSVAYPEAGSTCVVAGWGDTTYKGEMSDVLLSVNVTVIDRSKCNSQDYYNFNPYITRGQICAGSDGTNIADSCQGDSGGPLLCNGKLVGVTSFGIGCGRIDKPGVYVFLSNDQLYWIKLITEMRLNEIKKRFS